MTAPHPAIEKPAPDMLQTKLNELESVLQCHSIASYLWTVCMTDDERQDAVKDSPDAAKDSPDAGRNFRAAFGRIGPVGLWMRLLGVSKPRAIVECAKRAGILKEVEYQWLLRETGVTHRTVEKAIQHAIDSGGLVLVEKEREVHWRGQQIPIDWRARPALWEFFFEICLSAKHGRSVDYMTFNKDVSPSYAAKTKFQLVSLEGFPLDLEELFRPSGRNTLKLDLAPERIHIFRIRSVEILEEVF